MRWLARLRRVDRSFQTDARAKPARPDGGVASAALGWLARLQRVDRSLQTDARAKTARPDGGVASAAWAVSPRVAVALACLAAAGAAAGCGSVGHVEEGEGSASGGKELFLKGANGKTACAACHALADAGSRSSVGPNLDDAFREIRDEHEDDPGTAESTIRDVVRGQIAYPTEEPPTGDPGMPPNLLVGQDADNVAAYVASVAGLPVKGGGGGQKQATDGKTIFTQNCGSCHTLAAAGTSGNVGPNLDQAGPTFQKAVTQVTNGGGGMPPFKDQLSAKQIETVAKYVSESAGK